MQRAWQGVTAAAASAAGNMPADFRVSITDAPGADAYPISSFTWLLVYQKQTNKDVGEQIVKFLDWALTEGQTLAPELQVRAVAGRSRAERRGTDSADSNSVTG